jgi:hypothetical protein
VLHQCPQFLFLLAQTQKPIRRSLSPLTVSPGPTCQGISPAPIAADTLSVSTLAANPASKARNKPTRAANCCPNSRPIPVRLLEPYHPLLRWPVSAVATTAPHHKPLLQHTPRPGRTRRKAQNDRQGLDLSMLLPTHRSPRLQHSSPTGHHGGAALSHVPVT